MKHTKVHTKGGGQVKKIVLTLLIWFFGIVMVIPFIWMLSTSFKGMNDVFTFPIEWIPQNPTEEGYNALARTHDGQLCDIIIDRAALEAIYKAGKDSENELIRKYAEMTVVAADVKIAVRCHHTGKPLEFIRRALCPCDSLDVTRLARAAMEGVDSIGNCLSSTEFAAGAPILEQSSAAFERYCDNAIIEMIQSQQYVAHGVGPLAAYILGRENEIKTVRIILSGKLNGLPDSVVRERVRDMYV